MTWLWHRGSKTPEDQFADEVAAQIQSLLGMKVTKVDDVALIIDYPSGSHITMNLDTLFAECQELTGADREARVRAAVLALVPQPRPETWAEAAPRLMLAVRSVGWLSAEALAGVISRPFAPFMAVVCAIDSEQTIEFVTSEDLAKWAVTADEAFDMGSANLVRRPVQVVRAGPVAIVLEPDGYISSLLAAPAALRRIANDIGTDVIAIAPSRDQLALVDTSDISATTSLLEDSLKDYEDTIRRLSPVPYRVGQSGIEVWVPPQTHAARPLVDKANHILAKVQYGIQHSALERRFANAGEDLFVADYFLMQHPDGSVWSWAVWVKQVSNGLVPQVDVLMMGDNDNKPDRFAVRWADAITIGAEALQREPAFDPPLWRYRGWPEASVISALRKVALPFHRLASHRLARECPPGL